MRFLIAAAEEEGGGGAFNPFEPQYGLYVWTVLALIVVFVFLAKKVFPKLQEGLADREQRIKGEIEQAEATRQEAERMLEEYRERVAQAREESNSIIEQARQQAESVRRDLVARAEDEARQIVERTQQQLQGERERALGELQQQLAVWSTQIAGRIIERELTPQSQNDLVEAFIKNVGQTGASNGGGSSA